MNSCFPRENFSNDLIVNSSTQYNLLICKQEKFNIDFDVRKTMIKAKKSLFIIKREMKNKFLLIYITYINRFAFRKLENSISKLVLLQMKIDSLLKNKLMSFLFCSFLSKS